MKILVVHNFHRKGSASGDDQVFKSETELLEKKGNEVIRYTVQNDKFDNSNIIGKMKATLGMFWSFENYNNVNEIIKKNRPDLMHIHTFFPLISPSVLYAAKRNKCKVIATLHDTRFVCPCATSLRNGKLCNLCADGKYLRMFRHGCFKGSRIQSLIVAFIFKYHRIRRSFYKQIDKYICLNDEQMQLLIDAGFPKEKLVKKYNFVEDSIMNVETIKWKNLPERYVVFYGRIGEEKGIHILMDIWNRIQDIPLVIMGGGPMEQELIKWADSKSNIYYLGYVQHDRCLSIVKGAEFVVFPSIWYEGCSMVEIEAESLGKGLVVTDLGFSSEAVKNGINGYKIPVGDIKGFLECIKMLWNDQGKCRYIGKNARIDYENKYLPEDNYKQLMSLYCSLVK